MLFISGIEPTFDWLWNEKMSEIGVPSNVGAGTEVVICLAMI